MNNDYFVLHANCIPVKGATRSVICDLHRNILKLIPNDLFDILSRFKEKTLTEIKREFNNEHDSVIDDYFKFLFDNDYGIYTKNPNNFPNLKTNWFAPEQINNCIIDLDENSNFFVLEILEELNTFGCKHLQIRSFCPLEYDLIVKINEYITNKELCIVSIDFISKFHNEIDLKKLNHFSMKYPRTKSFTFYSSPKKVVDLQDKVKYNNIIVTESIINSHLHCGVIHSDYFSINIKNFTESLNYNSCLNRKISIDKDGNIKNCPSMMKSFGNIKNTTLKEALEHSEFKKHWTITKDEISVCKDCEFRYVCTDCRAFKENPEDNFSKPLKCAYNPYTNEWGEWSTNPLKEKAIGYYGMEDLIK